MGMNVANLIPADLPEKFRAEAQNRPHITLESLIERGLASIRWHECMGGYAHEPGFSTGDTRRIVEAFQSGPKTVADLMRRLDLTHSRVMPHVYRMRKAGTVRIVDEKVRPFQYALALKKKRK